VRQIVAGAAIGVLAAVAAFAVVAIVGAVDAVLADVTLRGASLSVSAGVPTAQLLAHWWVFPVSILFSMVALAAGVSGVLFLCPFFVLVVGLTPV
jgi:hypothetical protein